MKYFFLCLVALMQLTSNKSFAANALYSGESTWHRQGNEVDGPFGQLEQLGVQRAAEMDALAKCIASGAENCVVVATGNASQWNELTCPMCSGSTYFCSAKSTARGEK